MKKKYILTGYRDKRIGIYKPKRNKIKLTIIGGLFGLSFVVPMMTSVLTGSVIVLNKFKPLWIYR